MCVCVCVCVCERDSRRSAASESVCWQEQLSHTTASVRVLPFILMLINLWAGLPHLIPPITAHMQSYTLDSRTILFVKHRQLELSLHITPLTIIYIISFNYTLNDTSNAISS